MPLTSCLFLTFRGIKNNPVFQCLDFAFGRVTDDGSEAEPRIEVEEDPLGFLGHSDLIVSCVVSTAALLPKNEPDGNLEPEPEIVVELNLLTARDPQLDRKGNHVTAHTCIFSADLTDSESVYLVGEPRLSSATFTGACAWLESPHSVRCSEEIGKQGPAHVILGRDPKGEGDQSIKDCVMALTTRIYLDSPRAKELFETVPVQFRQTMPCTMRVTLGSQVQDVFFPLPMNGAFTEVHLSSSREDLYIEVRASGRRFDFDGWYADLLLSCTFLS